MANRYDDKKFDSAVRDYLRGRISRRQFVVRGAQRPIPLLNFREHGVESIDQPADFVAIRLRGAHFIILIDGNLSHRIFQVQNWPGN